MPEVPGTDEHALDYVQRVTRAKAEAGLRLCPGEHVLAADTEVVLDGRIFGKPVDASDAEAMLAELSGRTHEVISAVALASAGRFELRVQRTRVSLAAIDSARIRAYVASGEPMGKAGAYAIQGRAAAFIPEIRGSHSSVMGLPLFETSELLAAAGLLP